LYLITVGGSDASFDWKTISVSIGLPVSAPHKEYFPPRAPSASRMRDRRQLRGSPVFLVAEARLRRLDAATECFLGSPAPATGRVLRCRVLSRHAHHRGTRPSTSERNPPGSPSHSAIRRLIYRLDGNARDDV
jgi:hypothetical protein